MPKDMRQLMAQAQKMQEELQRAQKEIADKTYVGSAGGGVVKAVVQGSGNLLSVEFDPSVLDPEDPELVGDLVVAAVNQAFAAAAEDASGAMGGVDLGGLGGLLG
jgi:DNA-binding YbaB/EbfC family protein